MPITLEESLSPAEVAQRLSLSKPSVVKLIRAGEIEAVDTSVTGPPRYRVLPEAVARFIESRKVSS